MRIIYVVVIYVHPLHVQLAHMYAACMVEFFLPVTRIQAQIYTHMRTHSTCSERTLNSVTCYKYIEIIYTVHIVSECLMWQVQARIKAG